jgi:hypothetical protein
LTPRLCGAGPLRVATLLPRPRALPPRVACRFPSCFPPPLSNLPPDCSWNAFFFSTRSAHLSLISLRERGGSRATALLAVSLRMESTNSVTSLQINLNHNSFFEPWCILRAVPVPGTGTSRIRYIVLMGVMIDYLVHVFPFLFLILNPQQPCEKIVYRNQTVFTAYRSLLMPTLFLPLMSRVVVRIRIR